MENAVQLTPEIIKKLKDLASERIGADDDEDLGFLFDENPDDAYGWGCGAVETELAREICDALGIEYEIEPSDDDEE